VLALSGTASLVAFVAMCLVLKIEEFRLIIQWVRERGWRKAKQQKTAQTESTDESAEEPEA